MKKILIAPNAFKGALEAEKAAAAIEEGLVASQLDGIYKQLPIADGGDGSLTVISGYLEASLHEHTVTGPLGHPVGARWGYNAQNNTAVIELAEASGIRLVNKENLDPWKTTTFGTGELILEAVRQGAKTIYLTIGGSATVDGAIGILKALGALFYSENEQLTDPGPKHLEKITRISMERVSIQIKTTSIIILCDVTNPLLGAQGAARVFGPQKGASDNDLLTFEKGFENLSALINKDFGKAIGNLKHGGAAGGVSAVLHGILGAHLVAGGDQILEWANFDAHLNWADMVITGEGRIDSQTSFGKGPGLVAKKAKQAGKFVIGLSGFVEPEDLAFDNFDVVLPLSHKPTSLEVAMEKTAENLKRVAVQVGNLIQGVD